MGWENFTCKATDWQCCHRPWVILTFSAPDPSWSLTTIPGCLLLRISWCWVSPTWLSTSELRLTNIYTADTSRLMFHLQRKTDPQQNWQGRDQKHPLMEEIKSTKILNLSVSITCKHNRDTRWCLESSRSFFNTFYANLISIKRCYYYFICWD